MLGDVDDPAVCILCGRRPGAGEQALAMPAFLTRRDPLWRYAGRALHRECFLAWERREEFVHKFNRVMDGQAVMSPDGSILGLD